MCRGVKPRVSFLFEGKASHDGQCEGQSWTCAPAHTHRSGDFLSGKPPGDTANVSLAVPTGLGLFGQSGCQCSVSLSDIFSTRSSAAHFLPTICPQLQINRVNYCDVFSQEIHCRTP